MNPIAYCTTVESEGEQLHTTVSLPEAEGKFPIIIIRSPYMTHEENLSDGEIAANAKEENRLWLENGYAVVKQHCRGCGKSTGDFIPEQHERADGLNLQKWLRQQSFYNGELYLYGASYTAFVHYITAPFEPDVKGAVLMVMDSERYNACYRNGFFKSGEHGGWYAEMYKQRSMPHRNYVPDSFLMLPLSDFSQTVFGEAAEEFDETLRNPRHSDSFWNDSSFGAARGAVANANIPILLTTGFYDIYTGGIFDMWNAMGESTRRQSALAVHPYDHSGTPDAQPVTFPNGKLEEQFGDWAVRWFNHVRGKCEPPFPKGQVTYYRLFENRWQSDDFRDGQPQEFSFGEGERTYCYNPYAPASFRGGLSTNFGGTAYQDAPNSRYDILSFYTEPFEADHMVKGKMRARLCVRSDCPDTCFYMRLSLETPEGDYGLRDDINSISNFQPEYEPGGEVMMDFTFDQHAFLVRRGQRLRVDISSSAFPQFVRHTNRRGPFAEQTSAQIAHNTVNCDKSCLILPLE